MTGVIENTEQKKNEIPSQRKSSTLNLTLGRKYKLRKWSGIISLWLILDVVLMCLFLFIWPISYLLTTNFFLVLIFFGILFGLAFLITYLFYLFYFPNFNKWKRRLKVKKEQKEYYTLYPKDGA